MGYTTLGIILLAVSLIMIVVGIFLLYWSHVHIRARIEVTASAEEEIGPYTVYGVNAVISAAGTGIAENPVLRLIAEPVDETMNTVWDQQTILLGRLKAGTKRTIETKITIPSGCDVCIKANITSKSSKGRTEIDSVESKDTVVRSATWNENQR